MGFIQYLKDTKVELRQVNWPNRQQTVNFTLIVLGLSLAVAIFLGLFDAIFTYLLKIIIA